MFKPNIQNGLLTSRFDEIKTHLNHQLSFSPHSNEGHILVNDKHYDFEVDEDGHLYSPAKLDGYDYYDGKSYLGHYNEMTFSPKPEYEDLEQRLIQERLSQIASRVDDRNQGEFWNGISTPLVDINPGGVPEYIYKPRGDGSIDQSDIIRKGNYVYPRNLEPFLRYLLTFPNHMVCFASADNGRYGIDYYETGRNPREENVYVNYEIAIDEQTQQMLMENWEPASAEAFSKLQIRGTMFTVDNGMSTDLGVNALTVQPSAPFELEENSLIFKNGEFVIDQRRVVLTDTFQMNIEEFICFFILNQEDIFVEDNTNAAEEMEKFIKETRTYFSNTGYSFFAVPYKLIVSLPFEPGGVDFNTMYANIERSIPKPERGQYREELSDYLVESKEERLQRHFDETGASSNRLNEIAGAGEFGSNDFRY